MSNLRASRAGELQSHGLGATAGSSSSGKWVHGAHCWAKPVVPPESCRSGCCPQQPDERDRTKPQSVGSTANHRPDESDGPRRRAPRISDRRPPAVSLSGYPRRREPASPKIVRQIGPPLRVKWRPPALLFDILRLLPADASPRTAFPLSRHALACDFPGSRKFRAPPRAVSPPPPSLNSRGSFATQYARRRTKLRCKTPGNPTSAKTVRCAPFAIFGHILSLDLRRFPEKRRFDSRACRSFVA
jgi:hypothetical protein